MNAVYKRCCLFMSILMMGPSAIGQTDGKIKPSQHAQTQATKPKQSKLFVGVLQSNTPKAPKHPSEYCLEDGNLYGAASHHLGEMKLMAENGLDLSGWEGKEVLITGVQESDLTTILVKKGACPPHYGQRESTMQMRNDWAGEETGFTVGRSTHERLKKVSFIRASKIRESSGVSYASTDDDRNYELTFANKLPIPISDIVLKAHYESSSRGKPIPHYKEQAIERMPPGETVKWKVVKEFASNQHEFKLVSFRVYGVGEEYYIDLDINLPNQ